MCREGTPAPPINSGKGQGGGQAGGRVGQNIDKKVNFDDVQEFFQTSNLAESIALVELPIHCRGLFRKKTTGTPPNRLKTAQTPT